MRPMKINGKRQTIHTDSSGRVVAGFPLGIVDAVNSIRKHPLHERLCRF